MCVEVSSKSLILDFYLTSQKCQNFLNISGRTRYYQVFKILSEWRFLLCVKLIPWHRNAHDQSQITNVAWLDNSSLVSTGQVTCDINPTWHDVIHNMTSCSRQMKLGSYPQRTHVKKHLWGWSCVSGCQHQDLEHQLAKLKDAPSSCLNALLSPPLEIFLDCQKSWMIRKNKMKQEKKQRI